MIDLVGLDAAQDERPGEPAQPLGGVVVPVSLDRLRVPLLERRGRAEQPGLANSRIDHRSARRFSTGVPVTAIRVPAGMERIAVACLVAAFLIACASSTTTRRQVILRSSAASRAASAYVVITSRCRRRPRLNCLPRARSAPWWTCTRSCGVKRAASRCQLPTSDIGQTSRLGGPPLCSYASSASSCTVLPRPMSSASTPPRPARCRKSSQARPRSWYGRSRPVERVGHRHRLRRAARHRPDSSSPEPAVGLDALDRQAVRAPHRRPGRAEQLTDSCLSGPADQLQAGRQPPGVQLDPLAAQPHHRAP